MKRPHRRGSPKSKTSWRRIRIELAAADAAATQARETVHAHELEINRRQQQIALDTQQAEMLLKRAEELEVERQQLESRREPERHRARRPAPGGGRSRERRATKRQRSPRQPPMNTPARRQAIDALEQDVENARGDVYAVLNTITALNAAHENRRRRSASAPWPPRRGSISKRAS